MFAGLDVGSTNTKFTVYGSDGMLLSEACKRYPVAAGSSRLTAELIWSSVQEVMRAANRQMPSGCSIDAMAVSAFGESLIPVDKNGRVLSDHFVCSSAEGKEQLQQILAQIPASELRDITGVFPHRRFPLVKMLWFQQQTHICQVAARFLTIEDFLIYRLTGQCVISDSSAARTMAYDQKKRCWSNRLLGLIGVKKEQLSDILPSGSYVGRLRTAVCRELGMSSSVNVFTGGHDQMCNAVGVGLGEANEAINCSGTMECIAVIAERTKAEVMKRTIPLQVAPYPEAEDHCFTFWAPVSGCASLDWCLHLIAGSINMEENELVNRHIDMQKLCTEKPSGLLTAPYFTGRNYPDLAGGLYAAVWGVNFQTTPQEVYQSVMEGITYELLICLKKFQQLNPGIERMIIAGGGANSDFWMQMKANIIGMPAIAAEHRQSGTMGAMLLAAVGSGCYQSLADAARACVRIRRIFYPDRQLHQAYTDKFTQYMVFRENLTKMGHHTE